MAALLLSLLLLCPRAEGLSAAAGKVDITPDLKTQKTYLAGFGARGRKPAGVHDPLYARILVLAEGEKTIAIVGLDLLGYYRNDTEELRRMAGFSEPGRYLFVAATHQHSGPDTLGLWGPMPGVSGVNKEWHRQVKEKVAAEVRSLASRLEPASLDGSQRAVDPRGLCRDSRDPKVIDPDLAVLRVRAVGRTIATLINWSCHPEVLPAANRLITADFPGPLCERVEEKTGGACVYLSGSIGGLMTPDSRPAENFYESQRIGAALADLALEGLRKPTASERAPRLAARSETVLVPVENSRYLLFLPALSFGHRLLDPEGRPLPRWKTYWLPLKHLVFGLAPEERPRVETEVSVLDIGPARLLGIPAEIFPELVIGGYDGAYRAGRPLVDPANPDPPDLKRAPKGPYLKELIQAPLKLVVGLANDELGYLVPEYDFKVRPTKSMSPRLPGHHYEETNSIGPSATRLIVEAARRLLKEGR